MSVFVLLSEGPLGMGQDYNLGWKSWPKFFQSERQVNGKQSGLMGLY